VKLSIRIRYDSGPALRELGLLAEDLGLAGVWVSEPWGFDAGPALGWLAARTTRILLGTHIISVFARTAAATAGLAASLATVSDGRFRLGLGTSGPQVVEGWHGVPFDRPVGRTRDTIQVVRTALAGEPLAINGTVVTLPLPGSDGKPLRFSQLGAPLRVPIYLGALGPANQRLTAELADGWTPIPYSPDAHDVYAAPLLAALAASGRANAVSVAPVCPVAIGARVADAMELEQGWSALYLGGMGTPTRNFYAAAARRMGFGTMVDTIQERWQAGDRHGARAAVTADYMDAVGLFGPIDRIRQRLQRYADAGVDEVVLELRKKDLDGQAADLRALAALID
jgi:F420-dependent oxidoreductase-like protein